MRYLMPLITAVRRYMYTGWVDTRAEQEATINAVVALARRWRVHQLDRVRCSK